MKKMLLGALIGIGVMVLGVVLLMTLWTSPVPDVMVDLPRQVALEEEFEIVIHLSNPHPETIKMDNVDIPDRFFDDFEVLYIDPPSVDDSPFGGFGSQTWYLDTMIPTHAKREIVLGVRALSIGDHVIEFEVCNSTQDCVPVVKALEVR